MGSGSSVASSLRQSLSGGLGAAAPCKAEEPGSNTLADADLLSLLGFGQRLLRPGPGAGPQDPGHHAVFLLLLIANAKRAIGRWSAGRFGKAFLSVATEQSPWHGDLQDALEALDTSNDKRVLENLRDRLRSVALAELGPQWEFQQASAPVEAASSVAAPAAPEEAATARVPNPMMRALTVRLDEFGSGKERSRPEEQQKTAEASLGAALPVMVQAIHKAKEALQELGWAAKPHLGGAPLVSPHQADWSRCEVPATGCELLPRGHGKHLTFEAFGTNLLDRLRQGIDELSDERILQELGDPSRRCRPFTTNSRSGEIFMSSPDGGFVVKTISKVEAEAFIDTMPRYTGHIRHGPSILCRYLYLFHLDLGGAAGRCYVTIMRSVMDPPAPLVALYDLKGVASERHVPDPEAETIRKDQNWLDDGHRLRVSEADSRYLQEAHSRDTAFLSSCNIMDYSLLVGIASKEHSLPASGPWCSVDGSELYFIGIIDFLVEYCLKLRLYHLYNWGLRRKAKEDCVVNDPDFYAARQRVFFRERMLADTPASQKGAIAFDGETFEEAPEEQLPPPHFEDRLWIASCRAPGELDSFSKETLLYQPDCRLFCPSGLKCKFLEADGNGPDWELRSSAHRELFIHTTASAVAASELRECDCRHTGVRHETWGGHECWDLERLLATSEEAEDDWPSGLGGRSVVVFVHGAATPFHRAMHALYLMFKRLQDPAGVQQEPVVLGFLWPGSSAKSASCDPEARANADAAAKKLGLLLSLLVDQLECEIFVVAHGSGARVALQSLRRSSSSSATATAQLLLLLAGAVPKEALAEGGEFARSCIAAREISIFYSSQDSSLSSSAEGGADAEYSLAYSALPPPLPPCCSCVDVSGSVASDTAVSYFLSPEVSAAASAALGLGVETAAGADAEAYEPEDPVDDEHAIGRR